MKRTWLYPAYFILSLGAQLLAAMILGVAIFPSYLLIQAVSSNVSSAHPLVQALGISLAVGLAYILFGNALLLTIVLLKRLFRLRNPDRVQEIHSLAILDVALHNFLLNLAHHFFLPLTRGTPIIVLFYRGMGARIGRDVIITTTRIFDCDQIEIGDGCIIGGGAAINGHTGEGRQGVVKKVQIGRGVTIGANTVILPGAVIEDHVLIGANSLIPKDAHLKAYTRYGGVPVRALDGHE